MSKQELSQCYHCQSNTLCYKGKTLVQIVCDKCGTRGPKMYTPEDATIAWNNRPLEKYLQEQIDVLIGLVEKYNRMEVGIDIWSRYRLDFPHDRFKELKKEIINLKEICNDLGIVEI